MVRKFFVKSIFLWKFWLLVEFSCSKMLVMPEFQQNRCEFQIFQIFNYTIWFLSWNEVMKKSRTILSPSELFRLIRASPKHYGHSDPDDFRIGFRGRSESEFGRNWERCYLHWHTLFRSLIDRQLICDRWPIDWQSIVSQFTTSFWLHLW